MFNCGAAENLPAAIFERKFGMQAGHVLTRGINRKSFNYKLFRHKTDEIKIQRYSTTDSFLSRTLEATDAFHIPAGGDNPYTSSESVPIIPFDEQIRVDL